MTKHWLLSQVLSTRHGEGSQWSVIDLSHIEDMYVLLFSLDKNPTYFMLLLAREFSLFGLWCKQLRLCLVYVTFINQMFPKNDDRFLVVSFVSSHLPDLSPTSNSHNFNHLGNICFLHSISNSILYKRYEG